MQRRFFVRSLRVQDDAEVRLRESRVAVLGPEFPLASGKRLAVERFRLAVPTDRLEQ